MKRGRSTAAASSSDVTRRSNFEKLPKKVLANIVSYINTMPLFASSKTTSNLRDVNTDFFLTLLYEALRKKTIDAKQKAFSLVREIQSINPKTETWLNFNIDHIENGGWDPRLLRLYNLAHYLVVIKQVIPLVLLTRLASIKGIDLYLDPSIPQGRNHQGHELIQAAAINDDRSLKFLWSRLNPTVQSDLKPMVNTTIIETAIANNDCARLPGLLIEQNLTLPLLLPRLLAYTSIPSPEMEELLRRVLETNLPTVVQAGIKDSRLCDAYTDAMLKAASEGNYKIYGFFYKQVLFIQQEISIKTASNILFRSMSASIANHVLERVDPSHVNRLVRQAIMTCHHYGVFENLWIRLSDTERSKIIVKDDFSIYLLTGRKDPEILSFLWKQYSDSQKRYILAFASNAEEGLLAQLYLAPPIYFGTHRPSIDGEFSSSLVHNPYPTIWESLKPAQRKDIAPHLLNYINRNGFNNLDETLLTKILDSYSTNTEEKQALMRPYWRGIISQGSLPVVQLTIELFTKKSEETVNTLLSEILTDEHDRSSQDNNYTESSSTVVAAAGNRFPVLCCIMSEAYKLFKKGEINFEIFISNSTAAIMKSLSPSSAIPRYRDSELQRLTFVLRYIETNQTLRLINLKQLINYWCVMTLIHAPIMEQPGTDSSVVTLTVSRRLLEMLGPLEREEIEREMRSISSPPHGMYRIANRQEQEQLIGQIFAPYRDNTQTRNDLALDAPSQPFS